MSKETLRILYLYPYEMNTYGDWGNVITLQKRAERRGIRTEVIEHRPGSKLPTNCNLIFMGGGQDSGQSLILEDLHAIGTNLKDMVNDGVPALTICGGYQLFGESFLMSDGSVLEGLGIFPLITQAEEGRLIGNVQVKSSQFGMLYGFENHSGRTTLHAQAEPLGRVLRGSGNNGRDHTEGIVFKNAIGTYLHGPVLPKNPVMADWLIARAIGVLDKELVPLDDPYSEPARATLRRLK
ncbi:glutamine amidotransferase [Candidatus Saccharibacteria bacterium]|nr:glutamine amidotransferase [Candidatus Saccharibacteria bacterium]